MKWININDKLPKHKEVILVRNSTGEHSVCIFIDSNEMNKVFIKNGIKNVENVDKNPYHFCSQEIQGATLNDVKYWMYLPETPNASI